MISGELWTNGMKSADRFHLRTLSLILQMLSRIPKSYASLLSHVDLGRSDRRGGRLGDDDGR